MPPEPVCPLCASSGAPLRYPGHTLPVRQCACGMIFLWPQPDEAQLREIYQPAYHRSWGVGCDDEAALRAMKHKTFGKHLRMLPRGSVPGRVLDVGCATGYFLEIAAAAGWEAYGVEISTYAAGLAQSAFGEHVFNGTLEQACYPDGFFDMMLLSDIIEHVREPRSLLKEARRVLCPDGTAIVVTPNASSLSARLMGRHWSHYNAEHLHYFLPVTIKRLLRESGFVVEIVSTAPKYLNLNYIFNQFRRNSANGPLSLCSVVASLLPIWFKRCNFPVHCGEMLVLARKT